ncbi:hypothetical protein [Vibrio parahaemolyticus]|uniref:hypothetical protein n=1 Tax=Vibrio parahaemolyticus TaxID=670 RepID=UPI00235A39B3|nr:hypothetical protein [Vibrio parahaemolyticus]WCZ04716.1 hypothetical protein GSS61_26795 [Vibrio parahaemolyticus]
MKNDELPKLLFIVVVLLVVLGMVFFSRWLDMPFDVIAKFIFSELLAVIVAISAIALKIKWTYRSMECPCLCGGVYMGLTR